MFMFPLKNLARKGVSIRCWPEGVKIEVHLALVVKGYPADTRRNDNAINTSKRRRDAIKTLLLRQVSAG